MWQRIAKSWLKKERPFINFVCAEHLVDVIPHPVPANKAMPKWFKSLPPSVKNTDVDMGRTVKKCIPVLDAVSQGYIIPLWCDFHVSVDPIYDLYDEKGLLIEASVVTRHDFDPIGQTHNDTVIAKADKVSSRVWIRPSMSISSENDVGEHTWDQVGDSCDLKKFKFGKVLLKFMNPWVIETPKGYSCKFSNPPNSWSSDVELLQGIVDTDEYYSQVNFPFVWKGNEEGEFVIERGTPIAHVVPFKREKYKMQVGTTDAQRMNIVVLRLQSVLSDRYRRFFRHKRKAE